MQPFSLRTLLLLVAVLNLFTFPIRMLDLLYGCEGNFKIQALVTCFSTTTSMYMTVGLNYAAYVSGNEKGEQIVDRRS